MSISGFYVGATKHEIVRYEFQKVRKNKQQLLVSYGQINKKKRERDRNGPEPRQLKRDFPGNPVAKTLSSQCKGSRFNPWSRN